MKPGGFPFQNDAKKSYVMVININISLITPVIYSNSFLHFAFQKPVLRPQNNQQPPLPPPVNNRYRQLEVRTDGRHYNPLERWFMNFQTRSKRIDVVARITFPAMFSMFNLVYWISYTVILNEPNKVSS